MSGTNILNKTKKLPKTFDGIFDRKMYANCLCKFDDFWPSAICADNCTIWNTAVVIFINHYQVVSKI